VQLCLRVIVQPVDSIAVFRQDGIHSIRETNEIETDVVRLEPLVDDPDLLVNGGVLD
jgi:hypothetical protein